MNIKTLLKHKDPSTHRYRLDPKRLALLIAAVILVVILLAYFIPKAYNSVKASHPTTKTANQSTKGEGDDTVVPGPDGNTDGQSGTGTTNGNDKKPDGDPSSGATLVAPTGNFVSNYAPSLAVESGRNVIQSVCNTTPGATCRITFTRGTETKSLEKRTTDKGGTAYWTWTLQDVGLTEGSWKITAVADLNGSSKSTTDTLSLEVKP
jgi:hypothetical protein